MSSNRAQNNCDHFLYAMMKIKNKKKHYSSNNEMPSNVRSIPTQTSYNMKKCILVSMKYSLNFTLQLQLEFSFRENSAYVFSFQKQC